MPISIRRLRLANGPQADFDGHCLACALINREENPAEATNAKQLLNAVFADTLQVEALDALPARKLFIAAVVAGIHKHFAKPISADPVRRPANTNCDIRNAASDANALRFTSARIYTLSTLPRARDELMCFSRRGYEP